MASQSNLAGRDPVSIFSAIGLWWKELKTSNQDSELLIALGAEQVDRMAHDLGMTADDLHDLATHGLHSSDEAPKMMAALGLDAHEVQQKERAVYVDILRNCARCGEKRQCDSDLATGVAAQHYEEYCLNAYTMDALRAIAAAPRPAQKSAA